MAKLWIFNTDQGSQFVSCAFIWILKERDIAINIDWRCWALDNIFVERLCHRVKGERLYISGYEAALYDIADWADISCSTSRATAQSLDYEILCVVYVS
jgi:putative transposase